MHVKVSYKSGMQYEAEARGHRVLCDQPVDAGGEDAGMTPPELLLVSLGTCAMYGMTLTVGADKAANPARLGAFRIAIDLPGNMEERHVEGARRSAEKCLVKNTLLLAPSIELTVRSAQAVA